jgi:hypothetical protein
MDIWYKDNLLKTNSHKLVNILIYCIMIFKVLNDNFISRRRKKQYIVVLCFRQFKSMITKCKSWARPGFAPGTSRTLSENHTSRPTSRTFFLLNVTITKLLNIVLSKALLSNELK